MHVLLLETECNMLVSVRHFVASSIKVTLGGVTAIWCNKISDKSDKNS